MKKKYLTTTEREDLAKAFHRNGIKIINRQSRNGKIIFCLAQGETIIGSVDRITAYEIYCS